MILVVGIGVGLVIALHGILVLRLVGRWSMSRRIVWWVFGLLSIFIVPAGGLVGRLLGSVFMSTVGGQGNLAMWVSIASPWIGISIVYCIPLGLTIGDVRSFGAPALGALATTGASLYAVIRPQWNMVIPWPVFASILWFSVAGGWLVWWGFKVRAIRRLRSSTLCLDCDYELVGVPGDRCPECGAKIGVELLSRVRAAEMQPPEPS